MDEKRVIAPEISARRPSESSPGGASVAYIAGNVDTLKVPQGPSEAIQEPGDFECNDLYLLGHKTVASSKWFQMERLPTTYGAINSLTPR